MSVDRSRKINPAYLPADPDVAQDIQRYNEAYNAIAANNRYRHSFADGHTFADLGTVGEIRDANEEWRRQANEAADRLDARGYDPGDINWAR